MSGVENNINLITCGNKNVICKFSNCYLQGVYYRNQHVGLNVSTAFKVVLFTEYLSWRYVFSMSILEWLDWSMGSIAEYKLSGF